MNDILTFSPEEAIPDRQAVFDNQGIPGDAEVSAEIEALHARALELLAETATPVGVVAAITSATFEIVYHGEGLNEPRTPVGDIFERADSLALFAVTLGGGVSKETEDRFTANDFALGSMLDSVASASADRLSERLRNRYHDHLQQTGQATERSGVLCYSPGYCGWHISGQKKLFEVLRPERIGITLRESFLMEPLKSVSGVIIAAPVKVHDLEVTYPFCSRCETRGCRERIRSLSAE
jgi:hypothetical protein